MKKYWTLIGLSSAFSLSAVFVTPLLALGGVALFVYAHIE